MVSAWRGDQIQTLSSRGGIRSGLPCDLSSPACSSMLVGSGECQSHGASGDPRPHSTPHWPPIARRTREPGTTLASTRVTVVDPGPSQRLVFPRTTARDRPSACRRTRTSGAIQVRYPTYGPICRRNPLGAYWVVLADRPNGRFEEDLVETDIAQPRKSSRNGALALVAP